MDLVHAPLGLTLLVASCWAISEDRGAVRWRVVISGLILQLLLAALLLLVPFLRELVFSLNVPLEALEKATQAGTTFVFGYLAGGPTPYVEANPAASFVLAFR